MNESITDINLWGLFFSAFVSSTLLPGGSEALLVYLDTQQQYSPWLLLLLATAGNTLGGLTSWGIGWWLAQRFPARGLQDAKHRQARQRIQRWGTPVLLLSWMPIIGDPLCLVAGWLRLNLGWSLLFIALGKGARYFVLIVMI